MKVSSKFASIKYEKLSKETIRIELVSIGGGKYGIDTEDAQRVEDIKIGPYDGLIIEKDGWISVVWIDSDRGVAINIFGVGVDETELMIVAQKWYN